MPNRIDLLANDLECVLGVVDSVKPFLGNIGNSNYSEKCREIEGKVFQYALDENIDIKKKIKNLEEAGISFNAGFELVTILPGNNVGKLVMGKAKELRERKNQKSNGCFCNII